MMEGSNEATTQGTRHEAFIALVKRMEPKIISVISHLGIGNWEDIQDTKQDSYEKIYKALTLEKLRELDAGVDKWAMKTVINTGITRLRVQSHHLTKSLDLEQEAYKPYEPRDYDQGYERVEAADELARFLLNAVEHGIHIPPVALKCLVLQQMDDLSVKEIAQKLNLTEKSVENRIGYLKTQLTAFIHSNYPGARGEEKRGAGSPAQKPKTRPSHQEDEVG
jgi:RNA polymerase sigma factor (sigma-70 family)